MRSTLDWIRWARRQPAEHDLRAGEAHLLAHLAGCSDQRGRSSRPTTNAELSVALGVSERQVQRRLRTLYEVGLVARTSRPQQRLEWALRPVHRAAPPVPEQLAFDVAQASRVEVPEASDHDTDHDTSDASCADNLRHPCPGNPDVGVALLDSGLTTTAAAGRAREGDIDVDVALAADAPDGVLAPALAEVLEVLAAAPGLAVSAPAVDAAMRAYPAGDHLRAAHTVASWAHEGGLDCVVANRLLIAELRRAEKDNRRTAKPGPPGPRSWDGGRPVAAGHAGGESPEITAERHRRQTAAMQRMLAGRRKAP